MISASTHFVSFNPLATSAAITMRGSGLTPPTPSLSPSTSSSDARSSIASSSSASSGRSSSSDIETTTSTLQDSPDRQRHSLKSRQRSASDCMSSEVEQTADGEVPDHFNQLATTTPIHSPSPRRLNEDPLATWDQPAPRRSPVHMRPQAVRQPSYPKRHSSFDTPREVPVPTCMSSAMSHSVNPSSSIPGSTPSSQANQNTDKGTIIDRTSTMSLPLPPPFVEPFYSLPASQEAVRTTLAYPHPTSPQIHTPPPFQTIHPFLPVHTAAADVASVGVETTDEAYILLIHLPGFSRDAITLATRKKRTLHIVADRWDNGGLHFERRISFGLDAEMARVTAEFNGADLKITVPRKQIPAPGTRLCRTLERIPSNNSVVESPSTSTNPSSPIVDSRGFLGRQSVGV